MLPIQVQAPSVDVWSLAHCAKSEEKPAASVNVVDALSPPLPVAVTTYSAITIGEIWNDVLNPPLVSETTEVLKLHEAPTLSLTKMLTDSFGRNPEPVRTTVEPGV
jgi:hypothetical protein